MHRNMHDMEPLTLEDSGLVGGGVDNEAEPEKTPDIGRAVRQSGWAALLPPLPTGAEE